MSKRTLALIILLVIVTGALLYVGSSSQQKPAVQPQPTMTPVYVGHTILSIVPDAAAPSAGSLRNADIVINTMGDNTTAAQAEIAYDPSIVTNVHITPGQFYDNPVVLFNTVDPKNGRISYALGIRPLAQAKKGTGTVATISYMVAPGVKTSPTFTFLPKTKVTAEGVAQSVLKTTNNATIPL